MYVCSCSVCLISNIKRECVYRIRYIPLNYTIMLSNAETNLLVRQDVKQKVVLKSAVLLNLIETQAANAEQFFFIFANNLTVCFKPSR